MNLAEKIGWIVKKPVHRQVKVNPNEVRNFFLPKTEVSNKLLNETVKKIEI